MLGMVVKYLGDGLPCLREWKTFHELLYKIELFKIDVNKMLR
jgi:hypothetical protein